MLRWTTNALTSSVGRKIVMGLTGLLLVGFLVNHLLGNLKLYADADGASFNAYVHWLKSFGWLLLVAEAGLGLLFVVHVVIALKLTIENREARRTRYVVRAGRGAQTAGSASMHVTGALILGFLIKHMLDFRFHGDFLEDPAGLVKQTLSQPVSGVVYVVTAALVGLHVSHGFRSSFQSLGASHPKLDPLLKAFGYLLAVVFAVGFASFPLVYLFTGAE